MNHTETNPDFDAVVAQHECELRHAAEYLASAEYWREAYEEADEPDTMVDLRMLERRIEALNWSWQELVNHLTAERDFLLGQTIL